MLRPLVMGLSCLLGTSLLATASRAADPDSVFFDSVIGHWTGPGEIVAGKYRGTKFNCDLNGTTPKKTVGMTLAGSCRVGMFSQPMTAEITKGGSSYRGAFLDGAEGKGLDIVSGAVDGDRMVVGLDRKQLKGAMVARRDGGDKLNITISVQVANELVPVIGMNLKREGVVRRTALAD